MGNPNPLQGSDRGACRSLWDAVELRSERFPALQTSLPMVIVYKHHGGDWEPHVLIAESAILQRAGAPHGLTDDPGKP